MNKLQMIASDKELTPQHSGQIIVGLSACLAGEEVRYNGGHTQSRLCLNSLSKHFTFRNFCPEVAAGFSTPRPTMRLIGNPASPKLVYSTDKDHNNATDLTGQLAAGFKDELPKMADLDGYILMKNSPSCGLERVKVYQPSGNPHTTKTSGLFAKALQEKYPLLPIEEEGRLHDKKLYENFLVRVYAYHNFHKEVLTNPSLHKLIEFHSSYKYLLMAHSQQSYRALGKLLSSNTIEISQLTSTYFTQFMQGISKPANEKNHTNTLLHILGYLKDSVPSSARQDIANAIHKYHQGLTPLVVPLTLLKHYLNQYGSSYIKKQRYFEPYPENINSFNANI